jgi:hypothetical protein
MKQIVNHRLALVSAFVGQYDQLLQRELSARYAFEMATRLNPRNREALSQGRKNMADAELERLTMEQMVEAVTERSVDELADIQLELQVVLQRHAEVESELIRITKLLPALQSVVDQYPNAPGADEARKSIESRRGDQAMIEGHFRELTALLESIAESVKYHDISEVTIVQPTLVLPK